MFITRSLTVLMAFMTPTAVLATAACSQGDSRPASARPNSAPATTWRCSSTAPSSPSERTFDTADGPRTYLLSGPAETTRRPVGIIFDFHGTDGTAAQEAAYSKVASRGPERGYVVVTPQGQKVPKRWTVPGIPGPDDVAFVESLADSLRTELCLGPKSPLFATGISAGASMSTQLACLSREFTAVAPIAGVNLYHRCPTGQPVSVLAFHGTKDAAVPYTGRTGWEKADANPRAFALIDVMAAMRSFAVRNGCAKEPKESQIGPEVTRLTWSGCDHGAKVELIRIEGGGHNIPGVSLGTEDPSGLIGHVTTQVDAIGEALDFFDATRS